MTARRKRGEAQEPVAHRPPMPPELACYDPGDWSLPDDPPRPTDGSDVAAWHAWETAVAAAYRRHEDARRAWWAEYGHLPSAVDPASIPDAPFDPSEL